MNYLLLITGNEADWQAEAEPGAAEAYAKVKAWWDENVRAGRVVGGHELAPTGSATTVRRGGDRTVVFDGPFAETKEAIGGYIVIDVPDLDAAIALARTWPGLDARCHRPERTEAIEIRPIGVHSSAGAARER